MLLALASACASLPVHAGEAYRCIARDGAVHWQDHACPPGSRSDRRETYADVPPAGTAPAGAHRPRASSRPAARRMGHGPRSPRGWAPARRQAVAMTRDDRCRQAKAWRTREAERLGLRRTYADLGRLDAPVRAACNGY
jgi:hypothetical protein